VFTLVLGVGVAAFVHAQTQSLHATAVPVSTEPGLKITLRVNNYAHIPPALLSRSEKPGDGNLPPSRGGSGLGRLSLVRGRAGQLPGLSAANGWCRLRPPHPFSRHGQNAPARGEALGFALPCPEDLPGCYAEVFYQRVADWVSGAEISAYQLLGHAMAHEIGHLLLGQNSHSRDGIMRPQWNPNDLRVIARASLRFTPEQAERLRGACLRRIQGAGIAAVANGVPVK